jgi:rare lipoprotein A
MRCRGHLFYGMFIFILTITFCLSNNAKAETGIASVYSGGPTANGEYAHAGSFTAAHKSLPFGTFVEVMNLNTGRSVIVRINDRGPYKPGRIIDLTPAGAKAIGFDGLAHVVLTVLPATGARLGPSRRG